MEVEMNVQVPDLSLFKVGTTYVVRLPERPRRIGYKKSGCFWIFGTQWDSYLLHQNNIPREIKVNKRVMNGLHVSALNYSFFSILLMIGDSPMHYIT